MLYYNVLPLTRRHLLYVQCKECSLLWEIVTIASLGSAIQFELCTLYNEYNWYIAINCDHHILCNSVYIRRILYTYTIYNVLWWIEVITCLFHLSVQCLMWMIWWIIVNIQYMYLCQWSIVDSGFYTWLNTYMHSVLLWILQKLAMHYMLTLQHTMLKRISFINTTFIAIQQLTSCDEMGRKIQT